MPAKPPATPRAVSYARLSKENKQHPGISAENQHRENHSQIAGRDMEWVLDLTDDGISASRFAEGKTRPDFERFLAMVSRGEVDYIVAVEQSRITRDIEVALDLRKLCRETGLRLLLDGEDLDPSTSAGGYRIIAQAASDELESEKTSDRIKRYVAGAALRGRAHGPHAYGYTRIFHPHTGELIRIDINDDHAKIIREIAARYLAGDSAREIAFDLNARGVPTPYETDRGWHPSNLRHLILNKRFIGIRMHGNEEYPAIWEPILSRADYEEIKRRVTDPARNTNPGHGTGPGGWRHLLSPVAICSECGHKLSFVGERAKKYGTVKARYGCLVKGCTRVSIVAHVTDLFVRDQIIDRVSQPDFVERLRRESAADEKTAVALEAVASIKAELEAAEAEYFAKRMTVDRYNRAVAHWDAELLQAEAAVPEPAHYSALIAFAGSDARTTWDAMSLSARVLMIKDLADVTVHPSNGTRSRKMLSTERIQITWKV